MNEKILKILKTYLMPFKNEIKILEGKNKKKYFETLKTKIFNDLGDDLGYHLVIFFDNYRMSDLIKSLS